MRGICLLLVIIIANISVMTAATGVPVLLKGKVVDKITNKPCEVSLQFKDQSGKIFKIQPNILDGSYQQVVNSGEEYEITFINYDIIREIEKVKIEYSEKYTEIEQNFSVKKMVKDSVIYSLNMFQANTSELTADGQVVLNTLEYSMKFTRGAELVLKINAYDAESGSETLINQRVEKIKNIVDNWAASKQRIEVRGVDLSKNDDSEEINTNFEVIVNNIKDPLK